MLKVGHPSTQYQTSHILLKGKPFSLASLDTTLPLIKILTRIKASIDKLLHFDLRLDHCLVALLSNDSTDAQKIIAAYLCHYPYRSVIAAHGCHPFRAPLLGLLESDKVLSAPVAAFIETLLNGSDDEVEKLSSQSPIGYLEDRGNVSHGASSTSATSREADLIRKAIDQTLSMTEQRHLTSMLNQGAEGAEPQAWLISIIRPADLVRAGANNPMVACEMIGRLCQEAIAQSRRDSQIQVTAALEAHFAALQDLPPNLRSFDLITRILRSERIAPAPLSTKAFSHLQAKNPNTILTTTVAHLARSLTLGGFLANSIRHLERRESDEESNIIAEALQSGLPEPSRREIEETLEDRMAREVSIFCHFVRSLITAALLFPPDLGPLRRQVSELEMYGYIKDMEEELASGSQAMLIELQHFALRFGRYRDGMRLYGELNSLT